MAERADSLVAGHKAARISGLLLLALAAFLLVSLATHSPLDPPNSSRTGAQVTVNRAGWVGAQASWGMLTAVGYAAYAVPLLAGLWAWNRFRQRPWQGAAARSAGIVGVALILSAGAGLPPWSQYTTFEYGGWLGTWTTGAVLVPLTGRLGSAILLGGLLGASFLLATDIDPRRVARTLSAWRSRLRRRRAEKPEPAAEDEEQEPAETLPKAGRLPTISRDEPAPAVPPAAPPGPPAPGEPGSAGPEEVPLQTDSPAELLSAEAPADGDPAAEPEMPPLPGADEIPAATRRGNGSAGNGSPRPEPRVSPQVAPEPQAPRQAPRAQAAAPESRAPRTGTRRRRRYRLPGAKLLDPVPADRGQVDRQVLLENARILEEALANFDVMGKVVEVSPGPVVTRYEVEPAAGVKVSRISALADDLARVMSAQGIRIQAPVPGKSVVGVEIANHHRETVYLREIVESRVFRRAGSELTLALGKTISGETCVTDLAKMPHLLVAGATGSGQERLHQRPDLQPPAALHPGGGPSPHGRSQGGGADHLQRHPPPAGAGHHRAQEGRRGPALGRRRDGGPLPAAGADGRAQPLRLQRQGGARPGRRGRRRGDRREGEEVRKLPYIVIVIDEFADLMLTAPRRRGGLPHGPGPEVAGRGHPHHPRHPAALGERHHRRHQGELPVPHRLPRRLEDRLAHHPRRERRRAAPRPRGHALPAHRPGGADPHPRRLHLRRGDRASRGGDPRQRLRGRGGAGVLRARRFRGGGGRPGRALRRGRRHRPGVEAGEHLLPAAAQ